MLYLIRKKQCWQTKKNLVLISGYFIISKAKLPFVLAASQSGLHTSFLSSMRQNSSPVLSCLAHMTQEKHCRWQTLSWALRTTCVGGIPRSHPAHFVPKRLHPQHAIHTQAALLHPNYSTRTKKAFKGFSTTVMLIIDDVQRRLREALLIYFYFLIDRIDVKDEKLT